MLNAAIMPHVLTENRPQIENALPHLSQYVDLSSPTAVIDWVSEFRRLLATPHQLLVLGTDTVQTELTGKIAAVDPSPISNLIIFSASDYSQLFTRREDSDLLAVKAKINGHAH